MSEPNDANVQVIENAARDDVRPGDHIVWERVTTIDGATITARYEGIARYRDEGGDWWTGEGMYLTTADTATLTIRRTVQALPTNKGAVIVPADGHEYITAVKYGVMCHTREAVLSIDGYWVGAWRSNLRTLAYIYPEGITPGTWKKGDR